MDSTMEWGCEGLAVPMRERLPSLALRTDRPGPSLPPPPFLSIPSIPPCVPAIPFIIAEHLLRSFRVWPCLARDATMP